MRSYQTSKSSEDEKEEVSSGVDNARLVCGRKWDLHERLCKTSTTLRHQSNQYNYKSGRHLRDVLWSMVRRNRIHWCKKYQLELKEIDRPFNPTLVRWLIQSHRHLRPPATLQRYVSWRFLSIQSGLHVRSCTWIGTCVFKFPMPVTDTGVDIDGADWDADSDGAGVELAAVSTAKLSIRWLISDG